MLRHYNRLDVTVSKHTKVAKEKYSIIKESHKFVNQLNFMPKEIDK